MLLETDPQEYERVKEFKYLGTILTEDNNITADIKHRIILAIGTSYVLKKRLNSPRLKCQTQCMLYKTLIKPTQTYGSECCSLSNKDGNMLQNSERILSMIYGPVNDNGVGRTRYKNELYTLYDEVDTVKVIKIGRLVWMGHLYRIHELDPCRKLTFFNQKALEA
jgi:hypothetical protein